MPDQLGEMLINASIPDSSAKQEEVHQLAIASADDVLESRRREGGNHPATSLRVAAGLAAAALLVAFLSLTPPGRALADDIAGLVGIGDEPTLDQSSDQELPAKARAVVVEAGVIPGTSQPYEISAYAADPSNDVNGSGRSFACLNFDLPSLDSQKQVRFESLCIDHPQHRDLDLNSASDNLGRLGSTARFSVSGMVSADVAAVKVTYETDEGDRVEAPVALAILDSQIAEQTGAPHTFGRFIAFLPDDGLAAGDSGVTGHPIVSTVQVTAYDEDGVQVADDDGSKFEPPGTPIPSAIEPTDEAVRLLTKVRNRVLFGDLDANIAGLEVVPTLNALIHIESGLATGSELLLVKEGRAGERLIRHLKEIGALPDVLTVPSRPLPSIKRCDSAMQMQPGREPDCS